MKERRRAPSRLPEGGMSNKGKRENLVLYSGYPKGLNLAPEPFALQESYERKLRQKPLSEIRVTKEESI